MAKHIIADSSTSQFSITAPGDTWVLQDGVDISVSGGSAMVLGAAAIGTRLVVNGTVSAANAITFPIGVLLQGNDTDLVVGASGLITSDDKGVALVGTDSAVVNHGKILAQGAAGVFAVGSTHRIDNTGTISAAGGQGIYSGGGVLSVENSGHVNGAYGIYSKAGETTIVNDAGGTISGKTCAIDINTDIGNHTLIRNAGTISGTDAIISWIGDEKIVNTGSIHGNINTDDGADRLVLAAGSSLDGDVFMGDGNDVLDLRHGKAGGGTYDGGFGSDTYLVSSQNVLLSENAGVGTDTVKSTVSYTLAFEFEDLRLKGAADLNGGGSEGDNRLYGNTGDNHLNGHGGIDMLFGFGGNDSLTGGTGADNFVFATGGGHDRITDFAAGEDIVNIHDYKGVNDFATLSALFSQHGADTVIHFGHGDVLTLENVDAQTLTGADFLF